MPTDKKNFTVEILGIDPGWEKSAYVVLSDGVVIRKGIELNGEFANTMRAMALGANLQVAIEKIQSFGKKFPVGKHIFETCYMIGRIEEIFRFKTVFRYPRKTIVTHCCGVATAGDPRVREAMIARYGGIKKGEPMYGIVNDLWSALAVCTYHADKEVT